MEKQILNGIEYTIEKRNVREGDKVFDKNGPRVYEAGWADYDESGWVVISGKPI